MTENMSIPTKKNHKKIKGGNGYTYGKEHCLQCRQSLQEIICKLKGIYELE